MIQIGAKESMLIQVQLLVQEPVCGQVRGRDVAKVLEVVMIGRAGAGLGHRDALGVVVRVMLSVHSCAICCCDSNIGGCLVASWGIGQGMGGSMARHAIMDMGGAKGEDG